MRDTLQAHKSQFIAQLDTLPPHYILLILVATPKQGKGFGSTSLMQPYLFKNHCLLIDNFYTSIELLGDLFDKRTYCVGMACTNRKHFPIDATPAKDNATSPENFRIVIGTLCTNPLKLLLQ